ncbi:hypothetical protein MXB_4573 [Myxobolus squamalis]|nr:hypothetical protein MXB_4573 [Myxobolus squamalis]
MRALAQLLGPLGIKTINDSLDDYICTQMQLIKKFLAVSSSSNFETNLYGLVQMDIFFKKDPGLLFFNILAIDEIIGVLTKIGAACTFKTLLTAGLRYKTPVIICIWHSKVTTVKDFLEARFVDFAHAQHIPKLYNYLGYDCLSDFPLMEKLSHSVFSLSNEKDLWCRDFLVFVGLLPLLVGYIAHKESCQYLTLVEAFTNNLHLVVNVFKILIPKIYHHFIGSEIANVEDAMNKLCQMLSVLLCRMSNGTLTLNAIKNFENFVVIINMLSKDNPFLKQDTIEKFIPSCLLISATDKLLKTKTSNRRSKTKAS